MSTKKELVRRWVVWLSPVLRIVVAAAIIANLTGCGKDVPLPPINGGEVSVRGADQQWHREPLTEQQVRSISVWFEDHRTGWSGLWETPPLFQFEFSIKTTDGQTHSIGVNVRPTGDGTTYVFGARPDFPLRKGLSKDDIEVLRKAASKDTP
ncbi:hypothetical protein LMG22037_06526 [Paraburkholderia phenoliruptrix]|uniref:Uncharacterized protein n=1 Tax=Paraburkholderia phenoliruptrix TaxID=252970 RepID=A0A6J5CNQ7_9BURK|nr:hypothetical protein [Paraburkholderia phenoliruptrix]CAB3741793.1 hypothetical protein LMG22037_06526 [Paraburkholderia phenoliruptrix]